MAQKINFKDPLRKHEAIESYCQHGLIPFREHETEIQCHCPFCGREEKFYVNKTTKKWRCVVCNASGGFKTFLQEISNSCVDAFDGKVAEKLSKLKQLPIEALQLAEVGYNERTGNYTIPTYDPEGGEIIDLRIYINGRFISTANCKTGLMNGHRLPQCNGEVFICEGEWDGIALMWVLNQLYGEDDSKMCVCAVPGAGTMKPHWMPLFKGKTVYALYDHDKPGFSGAVRAYNLVKPSAKEMKFVHWPDDCKEGFDVRDLFIEFGDNYNGFLDELFAYMKDTPPGLDNLTDADREKIYKVVFDGDGMSAKDVKDGYKKWLYIPDDTILDLVYGSIIANRLPGDPLWMFVVASPGMLKSELLQSVAEAKGIESISTLTPHTLISGATLQGGMDPSLIPKLDNKVLNIKDFTTVLKMNIQAREEIFGVLRDAYDGEITKPFGNGVVRHYTSRFGIIAGVTPAIEQYLDGEAALGERFLRFCIDFPEDVEAHLAYIRRASENVGQEEVMRRELREIGSTCLNYNFQNNVHIPENLVESIMSLSVFVSMFRATVTRDRYTKEVTNEPFIEMGTRLCKQFMKLLYGICMFRRITEATRSEYSIVRRVAIGTVPGKIINLVGLIVNEFDNKEFVPSDFTKLTRMPVSLLTRNIEDLYILRILDKNKLSSLKTKYKLSSEVLSLVKKANIF